MNSIKRAYLFAGLAVFFWSTVATAFKIALREFDYIQLIFFSSAVTILVLFAILLFQGKLKLLFLQTRKQWANSMLLGSLSPLMYYLILFKAYSILPAQLAQPLNMVWPVTLALLSVPMLKQRIGWKNIGALFISFVGVVFISSQGGMSGFENTSFPGVFLAVGSSVIWALYWILNVRDRRDEVVKLFVNFCFGFLYLAVILILFSDFQINWGESFYAVVYTGIFEAGITYVLWMKAMQLSTNNAKIGNLVFLAPFVSLIFIHFILKETIFFTTFIGLVFIILGIFIQQLDRKREKNN
jgi:drug/metabolite transporter (DMT)-like permease